METILTITCPEAGCAYSICSEGTLFSHPVNTNGDILLADLVEVDWDEINTLDQETITAIKTVYGQLIECNKALGWYYQK